MESFVNGHTSIREIIAQRVTESCWTAEPEAGIGPFRHLLPDPITGKIAVTSANQNMELNIGSSCLFVQILQSCIIDFCGGMEQVNGLCCCRPVFCKMLHFRDERSYADTRADPDLHRLVVIERETAIGAFDCYWQSRFQRLFKPGSVIAKRLGKEGNLRRVGSQDEAMV